jgi:hypothetical protein
MGLEISDKDKEKIWFPFSFHCACYREEGHRWPKERIYMEAMAEIMAMIPRLSEYEVETNRQVADLGNNTLQLQTLKGEGLNAKFIDSNHKD